MGTVVCCLIAYGIMVKGTAADFSSDVDLATQYRALLSAHEVLLQRLLLLLLLAAYAAASHLKRSK